MSIVSMSSSRSLPEPEIERIVQLAVTLSGRLARIHLDDIAPAIAETLDQVAAATRVETCRLIEFTESGAVARAYLPTSTANAADAQNKTAGLEPWIIERLAQGELVTIARPDDLPREAIAARQARLPESCSLLGLPTVLAGRVICCAGDRQAPAGHGDGRSRWSNASSSFHRSGRALLRPRPSRRCDPPTGLNR
jgi:hypothetical protein